MRPSSGTSLCLRTARWRMQAVWWLVWPKLFGPGARAIVEGWTPSGHTPAVCEPPHSGACPLYVFPAKWSAKCYAPPNSGSAGAVVDRLCLRLSSASGRAHRKKGICVHSTLWQQARIGMQPDVASGRCVQLRLCPTRLPRGHRKITPRRSNTKATSDLH